MSNGPVNGTRRAQGGFAPSAAVRAQVQTLCEAGGESLVAVILFGSRLLDTSPDAHSATDLFVIVDDYHRFYAGLRTHGLVRRSPLVLSLLNRWLAPNVISVRAAGDEDAGSKCFVLSVHDLRSVLGRGASDHFCKGRLGQWVEVVFARDEGVHDTIGALLDRAREDALDWVPPWLPATFGAADFCQRMLEISYAGEIRPEQGSRVREVFAAQEPVLVPMFEELLVRRGPSHGIEAHGDGFVWRARDRRRARLRWWLHFRHSRLRATLRWSKYVLTYDGWLDYIVRKLHRRTGMRLDLTPRERRWPLLLLWPKFFRVLGALRSGRHGVHDPGDPR